MLRLEPNWIEEGKALWYRKDEPNGTAEFVRVDARTGMKTALFDAPRLASALAKETGKPVDPARLPFRTLRFVDGTIRFDTGDGGWELDSKGYGLKKTDAQGRPVGRRRGAAVSDERPQPSIEPVASPDGRWTARVEGANIVLTTAAGANVPLTTDGSAAAYYARLRWSADSKRLIATRVHPGDHKQVYLIQSTPPDGGPAVMTHRGYDRPGDRVDTFDVLTFDPTTKAEYKEAEPIDYGGLPRLRPTHDGSHYTYEKMDRGYGRWRIFSLDPMTDRTTAIVDDHPATFVDSTAQFTQFLETSDEIVYTSERDGWHHLYLADGKGGSTQVTKGPWVVRGVTKVRRGEAPDHVLRERDGSVGRSLLYP